MQIGLRKELWGRVCFDVLLSAADFLKEGSGGVGWVELMMSVIEGP